MGDEGVAESTAKLYVPKAQYDAKVASLRAEVARLEKERQTNTETQKAEMPEGLWDESTGTIHVAIRKLRQRAEAAEARIRELEGKKS